MAEIIGLTASITTVLKTAQMVISFLHTVKGASKDCNNILVEHSSVNGNLYFLNGLTASADSKETWFRTIKSLDAPQGPLEQFSSALEQLAAKLEPVASKKAASTFIWPFKKEQVAELLRSIERQKSLFILALNNDHT